MEVGFRCTLKILEKKPWIQRQVNYMACHEEVLEPAKSIVSPKERNEFPLSEVIKYLR